MKLHEFRIGDDRTGAGRDRETRSAGLGRIRRHGIKMPDAAGCEHDRARRHDDWSANRVACLAELQSGDRVALCQQRFGDIALDHVDRRRVAHRLGQCRDDGLAGAVALHMDDTPRGMRGLAADGEPAFEVAVEWHAVLQQIMNPRAGLAGQRKRDLLVDNAAAHRDRIGGMGFGAVALGNRRRDAALRPRA